MSLPKRRTNWKGDGNGQFRILPIPLKVWAFFIRMDIVFLSALFVIAFFYSSVGHGGASGYLALMALFGVEPLYMKSSALTLNLFVSGIALIHFYRNGHFRLRIILPFIITSVPMAFTGAMIHIESKIYKIILGVFLLIATVRMLLLNKRQLVDTTRTPFAAALLIGAILGFFAGMIGIGGGIILSPLLVLLHWANLKEAAAASALFILLNSASGLAGVYYSGYTVTPGILIWVLAAFAGGILGAYFGSRKFTHSALRYILSGILFLASLKLFIF